MEAARGAMTALALKMIYGEPRRALAMIFGMSFAAFLMAQQTAIFWGAMKWTYAPMRVVRAPLWIAAATFFGLAVRDGGLPPFRMTWQIVLGVFGAQLLAGLLGPAMTMRTIRRLDPAVAFRG